MFSVYLTFTVDTGSLLNTNQTEQQILSIAGGDKDALSKLYSETRSAVYGFVLSIIKNPHDSEDIVQDTYIRIFRSAENYKSAGKPMAWIFTIARNLCLMKLRSQKNISDFEEIDFDRFCSESDRISVEDKLALTALLKTLAEDEAQIVIMHVVTGLKNREIADIMNLPLSTVLSKYNRAIKKLRIRLEEGEEND